MEKVTPDALRRMEHCHMQEGTVETLFVLFR